MTLRAYFPSKAPAGVSLDAPRLRFEVVGPGHARALEALFSRNADERTTDNFDPFPLTPENAVRIAMEPRLDAYFVFADVDRLVGFSMLRGADEGYEVPSFGILIDRAARGRGLGRRLTVRTIAAARELGAPGVRLSVYGENRSAIRLYESLGFVERERHAVDRRGRTSEKLIMRLDFPT
jgi:ribosomal protein S18 acetylase RimI-like enzyme